MRKLLLIVAALLLLCLPVQADQPRLTLMIYMTGSNLESEYFAATSDIQEMVAARYNQQQINVLIMTGGSEKWWTPGVSADRLSIHRLSRANLVLEKDYPLVSMASPNPLTALLDYGYTTYPADKYALIIWDHGSGPVNGVCMDTLFAGDMLLPSELDAALAASPFHEENKLEWIGFDACLMANAETACLLAPYARYMIASQETEPGRGWDYAFLKGAEQDVTGADTGRRIIDLYYQAAMTHTPGNNITLSLLDLEKAAAIRETSDAFFTALNMQLTADNFSALAVERQNAQGVGRAVQNESDYDLVDLSSLASHYASFVPQESQALAAALADAVLYSRSNIEGLNGLSIYHPFYNKASYQQKWRQDYRSAALSPGYLKYLDTYSGIWLGEQLTSWKGLTPTASVHPDGQSQTIQLQLTASQAENFASAELLVFSASQDYGYGFLYREALNPPDENGLLSISYAGQQLVHTDAADTPLNTGLSYYLRDGKIVLAGTLSRYREGVFEDKPMFAYLSPADEEGKLQYLYMDELVDGYLNSRHGVQLEDWESFDVLYNNRVPTFDADGAPLAFDQWEDSGWILQMPIDLQAGMHFRFSRQQTSNDDLAAMLQIRDTQGNLHMTPLIPLTHLLSVELDVARQVLLDNACCTLTLTGAEVIPSALDPVIKLRVELHNKTSESLDLHLGYMQVNQTVPLATPSIDLPYDGVPSGETAQAVITIPLEGIAQARAATVEQLILYGTTRQGDWSSDSVPFSTAALALNYDFSGIPLADEAAPLAVCQDDALTIELLGLTVGASYDSNALEASIRVTNHTGDPLELNLSDCRINTFKPYSQGCSLNLPAGATALGNVRFTNSNSLGLFGYNERSFSQDMLSDLQITAIESLSTWWNVTRGDDVSTAAFRFDLAEPFPYAEHRATPMGQPMETVTLCEGEDFSIRLAGVATSYEVNIGLLLENHTDTPLTLDWDGCAINGVTDSFVWGCDTIPANTIVLDHLPLGAAEGTTLPDDLQTIALTCTVSTADGTALFRDSYRIDVGAPAIAPGLFYPDQLKVEILSHKEDLYTPFLADSLILPENPEQYCVRLAAAPHSPAVSAEATLLIKYEDYYIPVVRGIGLTQQDCGSWCGEYSGLYIGWRDHPAEFWYAKETGSQGSLTRWALGQLVCLNFDHDMVNCTDAVVTWDTEGDATIDFASMPHETAFPESYAAYGFSSRAPVFTPEHDAQGPLPAFREMPQANAAWECSVAGLELPLQFALYPAAHYPGELLVLYSFTLEDGSSYSTEPVPYAQAAIPVKN